MYGTSGLPIEVDFFVREPFDFEDHWAKRVEYKIDQTTIILIDKHSLIELMKIGARPKDLEDIEALQELSDE